MPASFTSLPYLASSFLRYARIASGVPPGDYEVRVWQPRMAESEESTVKRITIAKSGASDAEWSITLKPAFKIRRAPGAGRGGYR